MRTVVEASVVCLGGMNQGGLSVGTSPGDMGGGERLQLGWQTYKASNDGSDRNLKIGPSGRDASQRPQALLVNLPDKQVSTNYNIPHSGTTEWWGGSADNLNSTLTRTIDLSSAPLASVDAWPQNDPEEGHDFLYAEVSTNGGASGARVGDP